MRREKFGKVGRAGTRERGLLVDEVFTSPVTPGPRQHEGGAGLPDHDVLDIAFQEQRILIACDRDFGELVFVRRLPHAGVILLRLGSSPPLELTTARLEAVLSRHANDLHRFLVVTPQLVRVR